ncbi:MAG: tyrosine/phenylalanine carboxypeptidase domain-containing protein [Parcubacteria group bacterium]
MYDLDRFERLKEALRVEDFEFLTGSGVRRNYERACVVNGMTSIPKLDYPRLASTDDMEKLERCEQILCNEWETICLHGHPQAFNCICTGWPKGVCDERLAIDSLYLMKIAEKFDMILMLKAAAKGNDQDVHNFSAMIYPFCDKDIAMLTVRLLRGRVRMAFATCCEPWEKPILDAANDVAGHLSLFPSTDNVTMRSVLPLPKLERLRAMFLKFEEVQGDLMRIPWEELFPGQPYVPLVKMASNDPRRQRILSVDDELRILQRACKTMSDRWNAVIKKGHTVAAITYEREQVWVPDQRPTPMTYQNWFSFYVHEVLRHLTRHINGHRTGLALLGEGLAGYLAAEEGITVFSEYMVGKTGFLRPVAGMETHFALAIATGVIDGVQRNFQETYQILYPAERLTRMLRQRRLNCEIKWALAEGRTPRADPIYTMAECDAQAQREAYDTCVRIFRGTSGTERGRVFAKDSVYMVGVAKIARWVEQLGDNADKAMYLWLEGKFDPTDKNTLAALSSFKWFRQKLAAAGIVL